MSKSLNNPHDITILLVNKPINFFRSFRSNLNNLVREKMPWEGGRYLYYQCTDLFSGPSNDVAIRFLEVLET